ncbi:MAG: helix-turn-helix transcriptional regulator [Candidatus Symbiothrix sp.]|jgi:predicted RNase H-like HicB family nuclease|nr:helix-turn-helix transcriptional regulator [Candidatus Symbiothrix sp.]
MEKLKIIIEKSIDSYSAYAENCSGIYGAGNSVDEVRKNVMEGLRLFIKYNEDNLPEILKKNYAVEYLYDIPSFLEYYSKVFTKSALGRITGINQTQFSHYISGFRKPSKKTVEKLDQAIHQLANELNQTHFI